MAKKDESPTNIGCLSLIFIGAMMMVFAILAPSIEQTPGNSPIKSMLIKSDQEQARKTAMENEKNYLMYHPKPFTLKESVVSKTFTPQFGKYSPADDTEDVSEQASGYLKAIKNIKDYTVQVSTTGSGTFDEASKTVTLNRK